MVMLNLNTHDTEFSNASQDREFALLPDGEYIAQIINSEERTTKSGQKALVLTWKVIDGEHKNRQLFDWFNLYDPTKPKQTAFNRQRLFFVTRACGLEQIEDTSQLHNRPIRLTVRQDEYNGKSRNVIQKYQPIQRITEARPQAQAMATANAVEGDLPF